ncbi:probable LRR receptor-like serine/threonine-protein kinase RFK1 isoform X7 [Juglans microcarpa x Juglans regia]|uniref:probable LRR receptor-like serine/threonine-protein kinase RFK1 isoform X7 n=1 Tax=Juglans microcarpa x Juglans regia TaxID=2249226 RepID=UPI001B7EE078|nr:probable LRR receptor-like serine/threonine-protein kinase RFK1 isoform X7 [Juglans microcarpa x Juglans regia]
MIIRRSRELDAEYAMIFCSANMLIFPIKHNIADVVFLSVVVGLVMMSCLLGANIQLASATVPQDEVDALQQSAETMGATDWKFNANTCQVETVMSGPPPSLSEKNVSCNCQFENNTCHIVHIELKRFSLPGVLSPELVRLRYLQHVDLAYNYLSGSIPIQWVSTQMNFVSLLGNRLSGSIPKELGNFSSLKYLSLEANQFSGTVPPELGKLVNLETLVLSSNNLSGNLPKELGGLKNLTDFRINDNNLNGTIPDFIQNWKNLERLEMIASGLEGPIPSSISVLEKLEDLRITDISTGTIQAFPELTNMTGLTRIVMRNCNISGEIPDYIWGMNSLLTLDLSFNKLSGELPSVISTETLKFIFLSGNSLSGDVPESILKKGTNVDLSYNNFTWQSEEKPACQTKDLNLNLFQSSPKENGLRAFRPCMKDFKCSQYFVPPSEGGKTRIAPIIIGAVGSCLIFLALCVLWWRCYFRAKSGREQDIKGLELQTSSFSLKQINIATNNFDPANKIGEGGFGPVYKGLLADGTVIAVKQLSSKSRQGNREFLNEIGMISCLQHPNLVKLYGCCIEGDQLLLVYEYLENNSLARALFGPEKFQLKLDWPTRHKICVGIAQGLAFLHEESRLKIVHRDIKGTNVLLDRELNPKISDFGLARLDEGEKTHISTRIAGTIGYMAPEYALWGYLTYKADVYSFGVVALEIVSGKHNMSYGPASNCACLLDWACHLQETGSLMELVDQKLGSEFNKVEAERMMKVAFLCTNASPSLRPTMSEVVNMLEGTTVIPDVIPEASTYSKDLRFKAIRDHHSQMRSQSMEGSQDHRSTSVGSLHGSSSASAHDLYEITDESYLRFKAMRDNYMQMESKTSEASHAQNSTSVSSGIGPSSTSEDLHEINLKNPSIF